MVPKGYLISYRIAFLYGVKSLLDGPTAHLMNFVTAVVVVVVAIDNTQ